MPSKLVVYQPNNPSFVSQIAVMRGTKSKLSKCPQRAAALANSRPISPSPIIPKRISLRGMKSILLSADGEIVHGCIRQHAVVNNCHQCASNTSGVGMLDHVASVDDAFCALLHQFVGAPQDFDFGRFSPTAHQHWL